MKKFIVKYKDGEKTFGEYESKEKASAKLIEFIIGMNMALDVDYFSPFDFCLEEVECEVNEGITDFESAKKYLVGKINDVFGVAKNVFLKALTPLKMPKYLLKNSTRSTLKHLLR